MERGLLLRLGCGEFGLSLIAQARRILVLHAPSGAGKSSLVMAGLTPALTEGGFDVWRPIRVNLDPAGLADLPTETNRYVLSVLLSLEEELPAERRRSPAELARMDLRTYVTNRPRRKGRQDLGPVFRQLSRRGQPAPRREGDRDPVIAR